MVSKAGGGAFPITHIEKMAEETETLEVRCVKCGTPITVKKDPHNAGWKCPECGDEFKNEVR